MNDHPRQKVLIFDACFVLFMQDKKQVQNFEYKHTYSYKIAAHVMKTPDRKDCVGDKYAFNCGNNDVSAPPLHSEQSTEHLW